VSPVAGEADGHVFIAMELVAGQTLRERMAPGLSHDEALRIATEIAMGLARAHEGGVVHRDLKPENVMVTLNGDVKILDLGLAKFVDPDAPVDGGEATKSQITLAGHLMGTPADMSPEQADGRAQINARSDVFSFDAMFYEMVSGLRPFEGASTIAVLYAVLQLEPRPLEVVCPDVPAALAAVVARCLKKPIAERFASGRELLAALGIRHPTTAPSGKALPISDVTSAGQREGSRLRGLSELHVRGPRSCTRPAST
jgi:eukaryotic-like serine/threonine-protein kinase